MPGPRPGGNSTPRLHSEEGGRWKVGAWGRWARQDSTFRQRGKVLPSRFLPLSFPLRPSAFPFPNSYDKETHWHSHQRWRLPRSQRRYPWRGARGGQAGMGGGGLHRRLRGIAPAGRLPHPRPPFDGHDHAPGRHDPRHDQQGALHQQGRRGRQGRRGPGNGRERAGNPPAAADRGIDPGGRRRFADHGPAALRGGFPDHRRAQDHRQRPGSDGHDLRLRLGRGVRGRLARPAPDHRRQPQAGDGAGGDGPARGLDRALRRAGGRGQRHPDPRDSLFVRQAVGVPDEPRPRRLHEQPGRGGRGCETHRWRGNRAHVVGDGRVQARRRRRAGGGGDRRPHGQGNALHGAGAPPARRHANDAGPHPGHPVRGHGGAAHQRGAFRHDGVLSQLPRDGRAHRRGRAQAAHGQPDAPDGGSALPICSGPHPRRRGRWT